MRRLPVTYRPQALEDLSDIFWLVLRASREPATARGFVERIKARCDRIGDAPHGGHSREDLAPGLRTTAFERSAVIAYVIRSERVVITNVFYGGRDYEALYKLPGTGDD